MAEAKAKPVSLDLMGRKVKILHLAQGLDLIGSKTSINHKNADLTLMEHGIHCISKDTRREVVIPFDNCKGYELLPK